MSEFCEHETFKDICGICHRDARITALRAENERLRAALHRISLGSQNSSTTKEDLGREARAVLENINAA